MYIKYFPELPSLLGLAAAFVIGWRERKQFHSFTPFLVAVVLFFCARLSDILIQLPDSIRLEPSFLSHDQFLQALDIFSDLTDTAGVFLLVFGFVKTMKFQRAGQQRIAELESLLPICAWCKNIRTADGAWKTMEVYLLEAEGQKVTHGICPGCAQKFMQESLAT